ncbi:MAG TPA: DUF1206 domain-containing protein [Mycobacteriales bacterium]|nr:DUF1206 domain-containing protein [Mycobacteriales bacterium]
MIGLVRRLEDSDAVAHTARLGLVSRGVVWTLIGVLALSVAVTGGSGQQADQTGALRTLAGTPGGTGLLVALAAGFLAYGLYRVLCAAVGHRDEDGARRWLRRAKSAGEVVLFLGAAGSTLRTALGTTPDSEQQTESLTARALGLPGGRWLVGLAGAAAVSIAVVLAVRAVAQQSHEDRLEGVPRRLQRPVVALGVAGMVGRSLAVGLLGGFVVQAAVAYDPERARGLDRSLSALRDQPFGPYLLLLAAAALLSYGLWSFAEAVWRDV